MREHCLARTVIVEHPHLDELVRKQVDVDRAVRRR
jgi:hypothetical protein